MSSLSIGRFVPVRFLALLAHFIILVTLLWSLVIILTSHLCFNPLKLPMSCIPNMVPTSHVAAVAPHTGKFIKNDLGGLGVLKEEKLNGTKWYCI